MRRSLFGFLVLICPSVFAAATVVSFNPFFTGPGQNIHTTSLTVAAATFANTYNPDWDSWAGFAFSTVSNTTDDTWANQYAAAQACSNAYAVAYHDSWNPAPEILFDLPVAPKSARLDNTAYTAASIRNGTVFNRAFTNGDYLVLTLTAHDLDGNAVAATNHYLADFRDGKSIIQTNWSTLDLSWMPPTVVSLVGTLQTTDVGAWGANTPMYFALADFTYAYSDGADGIASTNAGFLCWADGWTNYLPGTNVTAQWQTPSNATGAAQGDLGGLGATNGVVSLGDGGSIVLTFPVPIADGPGPDFAVFENAFSPDFLEVAFVEVSSDGANFFRFPNHCLETNWIDTYSATNATDPAAYGGFAGKHVQGSGTPFDLRELAGTPGLDVRRVTQIRIVDVPGNGSVTDDYGNPVHDPYPTFGSGGFDLDAVGVLNPRIEMSPATNAPAPALPGYQTVLEYKAALDAPGWTTNAPARGTPGFFRWRLVK